MKIRILAFIAFCFALTVSAQNVAQPGLRDLSCTATSGSGTAYACSIAVAPSAYVNGLTYRFKADIANTGAATINFNGLGAIPIHKIPGGITTPLVSGDIYAGQMVVMIYDGTQMQVISQLGGGALGAALLSGANIYTGSNTFKPTTGTSQIIIDTMPASQLAQILFSDQGTSKWSVGKNTDGTFLISDLAHTRNWLYSDSSGNLLSLAPNASFPTLTVTGLTPGNCLQASTGGLVVSASAACGSGGGGSSFYQTLINGTTTLTQRAKLKLVGGTNITLTAADNGTDTSTITIATSVSGGTGWSIGALSALPSTCTTGSAYFATDAQAGQQIYYCSSTNVYTASVSLGPLNSLLFTNGALDINPSVVPRLQSANTWLAVQTLGAGVVYTPTVFASLPTPSEGALQYITDASTNTFGATVTGGGINHVFIAYNGTAWTVAGNGVLSGGGSGPFLLTGLTSTTPGNPASGNTSLFFPTTGGPGGVDASGNLYAMPSATILNAPANTVWAGPVSGSSGAPGWRAIVSADLPSLFDHVTATNAVSAGTFVNAANTWGTNAAGTVYLSNGPAGTAPTYLTNTNRWTINDSTNSGGPPNDTSMIYTYLSKTSSQHDIFIFGIPGTTSGYMGLNGSNYVFGTQAGGFIFNAGYDFNATDLLTSGTQMLSLTTGLAQFSELIAAPLNTPSSSTATCTAGTLSADATYVYVCTATNTRKRVALSTF